MYNNPSAGAGVAVGGSGILAYTGGSSIWLMVVAALALLVLGLILAVLARRRSDKTSDPTQLATAGVNHASVNDSHGGR